MSLARTHLRPCVLLAALGWVILAGCAGATPPAPGATPAAGMPELLTFGETGQYRERLTEGLGNVSWASAYAGSTPVAIDGGRDSVRDAITASAGQLAGVEYAALALPDWVTVTRQLQVAPGDFTGQGAAALEVGSVDGQPRWVLYEWQGPEIPQRPDRPIVYRWVTVYALYDIAEARVTRLLATIRGEAHE